MPISTKELVTLAEELTEQQIKDLQVTWLLKNKEKLAAERKARIDGLKARIKEVKGTLAKLEKDLAEASGKKTTGKRDSKLKDVILAFLKEKGKDGAHVNDISVQTGKPKANINAFLASTGKKYGVKSKGKRSGIYFLSK
jgi:hypothetical protein